MSSMSALKAILTIQLFYAFAITLIIYSVPASDVGSLEMYEEPAEEVNITSIESQVRESTQQQVNVPLVDLSSLVFFSGNVIVDLMLNFVLAVPQMFVLLVSSFTLFLPIDAVITQRVAWFIGAFVGVMYFLGIIAFLMNIRTRGVI